MEPLIFLGVSAAVLALAVGQNRAQLASLEWAAREFDLSWTGSSYEGEIAGVRVVLTPHQKYSRIAVLVPHPCELRFALKLGWGWPSMRLPRAMSRIWTITLGKGPDIESYLLEPTRQAALVAFAKHGFFRGYASDRQAYVDLAWWCRSGSVERALELTTRLAKALSVPKDPGS